MKSAARATSEKSLRLVQVGLGGWGKSWASSVVPKLESVRAVAWVDASPAALEAARQTLEFPQKHCFASLKQALEHVKADAVLITAPASVHAPIAIEALEAGLHVLVEKPFAPTLEQARAVVEVARAYKRILMVSQNYRFQPAPMRVAQMVCEQVLGKVGVVQVEFRRDNLNMSPDSPHLLWAQPLLLDMAIHHFDLMRFILGQNALELYCRAWNPSWSLYRDPACAVANIGFDGGTIVNYQGSWVSPGKVTPWAGEWRLECELGEISFSSRDNNAPDVVRIRKHGKAARKLALETLEHPGRIGSLNAFVEAIRTGAEPMTSGRQNLGSLQLSLEAIRSSQTQQVLKLEHFGVDETLI
jgi:predicted dehydrogenase